MRSIDENYLEYVRVKQESQHIVQQAYKKIEHLSKEMKKQDENNQTVLTQMYLIEMMIENLKEELRKFSDTRRLNSRHNLAKHYPSTTRMSTAIQVQYVTTCFHNIGVIVIQ